MSWAGPFFKQLGKFPVAEHDEYVDCFSQAVIFMRDEGLIALPQAKEIEVDKPPPRVRSNPYAA